MSVPTSVGVVDGNEGIRRERSPNVAQLEGQIAPENSPRSGALAVAVAMLPPARPQRLPLRGARLRDAARRDAARVPASCPVRG